MRKLLLILLITFIAALMVLANATYYKHTTISVSVTNQPIIVKEVQSPYIINFMNTPTGIYVNISITKAEMICINNTESINITLAKLLITRPLAISFSINVQGPAQLSLIIVNSSNAVVAVYPNNTIINLSPGNYIMIERLILPINFTGSITVSGTYVVMIRGVEFMYNLNENIITTN